MGLFSGWKLKDFLKGGAVVAAGVLTGGLAATVIGPALGGTILAGTMGETIGTAALSGAIGGGVAGATQASLYGGDVRKGFLRGAEAGAISQGVSEGLGPGLTSLTGSETAGKALASGAGSAAAGEAMGMKPKEALKSGAITSATNMLFPDTKDASRAGQVATAMERQFAGNVINQLLSPSNQPTYQPTYTQQTYAPSPGPGSQALAQALRIGDAGSPVFGGGKEDTRKRSGWNVESLRYMGQEA
jgi:hypothetical protein